MSRRDVRGRLGTSFRARNMQGPRPVSGPRPRGLDHDERPEELPEPVFSVRVDDRSPTVLRPSWQCGQDMAEVPLRTHARTELFETTQEVHLLLISAPDPEYRPPPPGFAETGTGCSAEAIVELAAPLGERAVFSDYGAPSTRVAVQHDPTS